jgi:D-3-phosphoglycerate dehydrogenase
VSKTIVITDFDFLDDSIEREIIEAAGHRLDSHHALSEDEILEVASTADGLIVQYGKIGRQVISKSKNLKLIARYGVGVDIVDVDFATSRGIQVTNVPADYCLNEVADHALAFLLSLNRQLFAYNNAVRQGDWKWQSGAPVRRLADSTVGIVGFGRIGQAIAHRLKPFGSRVVAYDPYASPKVFLDVGVDHVTLARLLAISDYVVLQTPLTEETRGLIGEEQIRLMKPGAYLINTARGPLVDTVALAAAIRSGAIRGAGFDDLPEEPAKQRNWIAQDPLFENPEAIITPHTAYYSEESILFCRRWAANEAVRFFSGKKVLSPVNEIPGENRRHK